MIDARISATDDVVRCPGQTTARRLASGGPEELRKDKVERDAFLKAKHAQPGDIDGDGFQEHTDDYTPNWTDDHYDEEAARNATSSGGMKW